LPFENGTLQGHGWIFPSMSSLPAAPGRQSHSGRIVCVDQRGPAHRR
jgi:hypothetical protein